MSGPRWRRALRRFASRCARSRCKIVLDFYRSTIGKKIIMAVTGLIWVGFVILHMAGNLQAFLGAEKLNNYAAMLHGPLEEVVWLQRVLLFVALVLPVLMAGQLTRRAANARPV